MDIKVFQIPSHKNQRYIFVHKGFQILRKDLFIFFCLVLVTSMFGSKFMMSVGMISLIALSLVDLDLFPFKLRLSKDFFYAWKSLFQKKNFLVLTLIFWVPLVSFFWSADIGEWYGRNRMHIPFLGLAIAFLGMKEWSIKTYYLVLKYTIGLSILSSFLVIYYYIDSQSHSLMDISKGQSMWMPINHIRYSLLIAYASTLSFYFAVIYYHQKTRAAVWFVLGLFLFSFIHFIAVRSGIVTLYCSLIICSFILLLKKKNTFVAIAFVSCILATPFVTIKYVPTLKEKINYMKWDLQQFQKGSNHMSSDNRRIQSLIGGWEVYRTSPIIGVGIGDLKNEMKIYFSKQSADYVYFPHSEYVFVLASTGIFGLLLFLFSMLFPIFYQSAFHLLPLLSIQIIALISFFVENTIENAVGVAIISFFIIMGLRSHMELHKKY